MNKDTLIKEMNESFLKTLQKFIIDNNLYYNLLYQNIHIKSSFIKNTTSNGTPPFSNPNSTKKYILPNDINLTLYYSEKEVSDYINNNNKISYVTMDSILSKKFVPIWYSSLKNNFLKDEFFEIVGKIISFDNKIEAFANNPILVEKLLIAKKKNIVKIPTNNEFKNGLDLLVHILPNDQLVSSLLIFCKNNPVLFKRIEIQNILKTFSKRHLSSVEQEQFAPYLIQTINSDYFDETPRNISFYINKKNLFTNI